MEKPECACRGHSGRPRMVMPPILPWESGTNRYASQKGTQGFGAPRNNTLKIESTKSLSGSNNGVVPQLNCPPLFNRLGSQKGWTSFGTHRPQLTTVRENEFSDKVPVNKIVNDKSSEKILNKWSQPNPNATNSEIGKLRETSYSSKGGDVRPLTEIEERKCKATIPRFLDPSTTISAQNERSNDEKFGRGSHRRQSTCSSDSINLLDSIERQRYLAWMGGQITTISTASKRNSEDLSKMNYYERLMYERQFDPKVLQKKLEQEKQAREVDLRRNSMGTSESGTSQSECSTRGNSCEKEN